MAKKQFARKCNACGKGMNEGYCIEGGIEYYCSDECLHTEITPEEWLELYNDGEGDSYWTDWSEDPDEYLDDEDEVSEVERLREEVAALQQRIEDYKSMTETQDKIIALLKKQQEA